MKATETFGALLRRYRSNHTDLTLSDLAARLDMKHQQIGAIERGEVAPPMSRVDEIAKVLIAEMFGPNSLRRPPFEPIDVHMRLTQAAVDTRVAHWRQRLSVKSERLREAAGVHACA